MSVVEEARAVAAQAPEVVEAAKNVSDAAEAFAKDRTNKDLEKALDDAVHAHATAMSDALIAALLKVEGGRRGKTRKPRRGRKVRRTRKSRR